MKQTTATGRLAWPIVHEEVRRCQPGQADQQSSGRVSVNSLCMAGTRFCLFSAENGPKDLAEEGPEDASDVSVANGLAAGSAEVSPCACTRIGDVRHKKNPSVRRTPPTRQSKVSDMRWSLLLPSRLRCNLPHLTNRRESLVLRCTGCEVSQEAQCKIGFRTAVLGR